VTEDIERRHREIRDAIEGARLPPNPTMQDVERVARAHGFDPAEEVDYSGVPAEEVEGVLPLEVRAPEPRPAGWYDGLMGWWCHDCRAVSVGGHGFHDEPIWSIEPTPEPPFYGPTQTPGAEAAPLAH